MTKSELKEIIKECMIEEAYKEQYGIIEESFKDKLSIKNLSLKIISKNNKKDNVLDNDDNKVKNFKLIDKSKNLYITNLKIDGVPAKVIESNGINLSNPDSIANINTIIHNMNNLFDQVCKIVLSNKSGFPEMAITKDAICIKTEDVLIDSFLDTNNFYTYRCRCLIHTAIKNIDTITLGIITNTKTGITNVSWWDKWPL